MTFDKLVDLDVMALNTAPYLGLQCFFKKPYFETKLLASLSVDHYNNR